MRKASPYGTCTEQTDGKVVVGGEDKWFYGAEKYSQEACYRTCLQLRIQAACGCSDPRYELGSGPPVCGAGLDAGASAPNLDKRGLS